VIIPPWPHQPPFLLPGRGSGCMGSNSVLRFVERSHHWLYVSIMAPWSPTMSKVCRCRGCAPHFFETFHTFLRNLETICTPHFLETFGRIIWIFFWYSMKLIIYQSNAVLLRHCLMTIKYCPILYQIKKLTSVFHASVLLLIMNFIRTLSK